MHLVHVEISKDAQACVDAVAQSFRDGHAVGAFVGILYRRRRYGVTICGEAIHDPTWADGIASVVKAELMDLIREQGQRESTM